jgi:hypothetical protein
VQKCAFPLGLRPNSKRFPFLLICCYSRYTRFSLVLQELRHINRCMYPAARLQGTEGGDQGYEIWLLFESVPVQGYLPAFQQMHLVKFKLGDSGPCSCSCPHFTSTKLPCCAMCSVLASKNVQSFEDIALYMEDMWLVKNHPLFALATQATTPSSTPAELPPAALPPAANPFILTTIPLNAISELNRQALQHAVLPTSATGRHAVLMQLVHQLLPSTCVSAVLSKNLYELLIQHRSVMSNSRSFIRPPDAEISTGQAACGVGPANSVVNLSNISNYNPRSKKRIATAKHQDPSCYTVHKSGALGSEVQCLCGEKHINEHKVYSLSRQLRIETCNF